MAASLWRRIIHRAPHLQQLDSPRPRSHRGGRSYCAHGALLHSGHAVPVEVPSGAVGERRLADIAGAGGSRDGAVKPG